MSGNGQVQPNRPDLIFEAGSIVVAYLMFTEVGRKNAGRVDPAMIRSTVLSAFAREAKKAIAEHGEADIELIGGQIRNGYISAQDVRETIADLLEWECHEPTTSRFEQALAQVEEGHQRWRLCEAATVFAEGNLSAAAMREHWAKVDQGPVTTDDDQTLADTLSLGEEEMEPIRTGIAGFDEKMPNGGLRPGDKMVVTGPPGIGKTALTLHLTLAALIENPELHAVFATGEMSGRQLRDRALMNLSGLPITVHREEINREKVEGAWALLGDIGKRCHLVNAPLAPDRIESMITKYGARWVVIDYLQLCRARMDFGSRREEIDSILGDLSRIAQTHGCVVLIVSNQGKDGGTHGRDIYTACKESAEIGYTADLLYTGEMVGGGAFPDDDQPAESDIRWRCLKCRNGSPRTLLTRFRRYRQDFQFTR